MLYELSARARAAGRRSGRGTGDGGVRRPRLLVAVLIAGVVKASGGFSDTGIAEAVVKKIKGAITGVGEG